MPRYNAGARYNYLGSSRYNFLRILTLPPALYQRLPHVKPVVLDENGKRAAVLENAYEIVLTQEINGEDTLDFKLPHNDPKVAALVHERRVQLVNQSYIIRRITTGREEDGGTFVAVHCEAEWYDLMFADPLPVSQWQDALASTVLGDILKGTGWKVGAVEISTRRNLSVDERTTNRLQALRQVAEVWGGELEFDTTTRTVSLLQQVGRKTPVAAFVYRKNLRRIEREVDTMNLITRLYPYGANGLTIEAANNGVPYIDNFQYTTRIRVAAIKNERFTDPFHLKEWAEETLAHVSKPRVSYALRAADLSALAELRHEELGLGDVVRVYDAELNVDIKTRIIRWQYVVDRPWDTQLELSSTQPGLEDILARLEEADSRLEEADSRLDEGLKEINDRLESAAVLEAGLIPYSGTQSQTITVTFSQVYTEPPVIVATVQLDPGATLGDEGMRVVAEPVTNPQGHYTGAKLHVKRTTSTPISIKIAVVALATSPVEG